MNTHKSHLVPCVSETTIGGPTKIIHEVAMDPEDSTYPKLKEIFGDVPDMTLPHGGETGYLDYLKPEDLPATVVKGIDPHGRPFFAVRVLVYNETPEGARERRTVLVFHRRYEKGKTWVQAGGYRLKSCSGPIDDTALQAIETLKTQGRVAWEKPWGEKITVTLFPNP